MDRKKFRNPGPTLTRTAWVKKRTDPDQTFSKVLGPRPLTLRYTVKESYSIRTRKNLKSLTGADPGKLLKFRLPDGPGIPDLIQMIWDIYNFWDVLKWIWDSPICVNRVRTCPKWWINLEHLFLQMTDFLITSIPYDVTWHVETKIDFFF